MLIPILFFIHLKNNSLIISVWAGICSGCWGPDTVPAPRKPVVLWVTDTDCCTTMYSKFCGRGEIPRKDACPTWGTSKGTPNTFRKWSFTSLRTSVTNTFYKGVTRIVSWQFLVRTGQCRWQILFSERWREYLRGENPLGSGQFCCLAEVGGILDGFCHHHLSSPIRLRRAISLP